MKRNEQFVIASRTFAQESFWASAPRESFTDRCFREYQDHMRGSYGEKLVGQVPVVGITDEPRKARAGVRR